MSDNFKINNWEFPPEILCEEFDESAHARRSSLVSRSFSHGSVDVADKKFQSRTLKMKVVIRPVSQIGDARKEFRKIKDEFLSKVMQENFKLYLAKSDRYINVSSARSTDFKAVNAYNNGIMEEATVTFACDDPFWYGEKTGADKAISSSPTTFNCFNSGNVESYPIITITPQENCPNIIFKNLTDNLTMKYIDQNFGGDDELVVDCVKGTVLKNDIDAIKFFHGSFLRAIPRLNYFEYTGGDAQVKVEFVQRYF